MQRIEQRRGIIKDKGYNVFFNYNKGIGSKNFSGEEILQLLRDDPEISLLPDERLGISCIVTDTTATDVNDIIVSYTDLLTDWVNKHTRDLQEHVNLNAMRQLGFVMAFAAPSCLADRVVEYEQVLVRNNISSTRMKAFTPLNPFPLHYIDLWVSKMQVAELIGAGSPSKVRSAQVVQFLANEIKRGN